MAGLILHFLSCTSTRLFVLRLVIASALAALVYTVAIYHRDLNQASAWFFLTPPIVATVHHIGSAFGPRSFPLRRWMDIPLTVVEAGFFIFTISWLTYVTTDQKLNYGLLSQEVMLGIVSLWTITISIFFLLLLKVIEFIRTPKRSWSDLVDVARVPTSPWWKYPVFAIFGRKLWDARVPGEGRLLAVLRGIFAVMALATIAAFALYQVILQPIGENGLIPHRQFRTAYLPSILSEAEEKANWTALVVWPEHENATMELTKAVRFYWMFTNWQYTQGDPLCLKLSSIDTACEVEGYKCVQSRPYYPEGLNCARLGQAYLSNIHVTMNFTELFTPGVGLGRRPAVTYNAARVYVGLAEEVDNILAMTRPIHLFPGTHLLSIVDVLVRQRIRSPALATFGFDTYDTFLTVEPTYTIPSPFSNISNPNISTLSITKESYKDEWIVIQDYRNKSVLAGLASVGGLGSFLSALLVILLGTSLMRAVLRNKDHSPFGLLHSGMGTQMAKACQEKFPALEGDIERYQKDPGIIAYLLSTLIDMTPIGYQDTGSKIERQEPRDVKEHAVQLPHQSNDEEKMALVPREKQEQGEGDVSLLLEEALTTDESDLR